MCGAFLFVRNFCLSQTSEALAQPEERRAWTARVHRDLKRPGILHQKSTVLRRKYGAFLFAEADFWGLHCFACTVFKKECLPPGFSAGYCIIPFNVRRKVEVEGNVELIPTINIYPADKLIKSSGVFSETRFVPS